MISYHPSNPDVSKPWQYAAGFKVANITDIHRIARGISKYTWSGILWRNGIRGEENFLASHWCVFDFDDPQFTLNDALDSFQDCRHIIGTTKSHQKPKGEHPACDRFRVLIPWSEPITDLETFKFNMQRMASRYEMDKKCLDGARYFWPCTELVRLQANGYSEAVLKPERSERRSYAERALSCKRRAVLPTWSARKLMTVVPIGERSNTFYGVAKDLFIIGHSPEEILSLILKSPTYNGAPDARSLRKLEEAVRSAVKKATKEMRLHDRQ